VLELQSFFVSAASGARWKMAWRLLAWEIVGADAFLVQPYLLDEALPT